MEPTNYIYNITLEPDMHQSKPLFLVMCGFFAVFFLFQCSGKPHLKPFSSDGCSLFPDKDYLRDISWCGCCVVHDHAYWKGGSEDERRAADSLLSACVLEKTGDETLAQLIYKGTQFGGSEVFPNWYRWGYGWPYGANVPEGVRERELAVIDTVRIKNVEKLVCLE